MYAKDVVFERGRTELESVKGSMNRRRDNAPSCTCAVNGYKVGANKLTSFSTPLRASPFTN